MDAGLDQNKAEFGVGVAAEFVQVLAHGHGLLNKAVQILRDLGSEAYGAKRAEVSQWRAGAALAGFTIQRGVGAASARISASRRDGIRSRPTQEA